jgi:hypothetical protein
MTDAFKHRATLSQTPVLIAFLRVSRQTQRQYRCFVKTGFDLAANTFGPAWKEASTSTASKAFISGGSFPFNALQKRSTGMDEPVSKCTTCPRA